MVGASATAALDQGWDWVISQLGAEMAQMLIENKFTIAMAVAFILGAAVFKRFLKNKEKNL